jgi:hypothetical protein
MVLDLALPHPSVDEHAPVPGMVVRLTDRTARTLVGCGGFGSGKED